MAGKKKHVSGQSDIVYSEEIKPTALAVIELDLSESIS